MPDVPAILLEPLGVGEAIREAFTIDTPAAGADASVTMEGRYTTRLVCLHAKLVTDNNVANREVVLSYRDQGALRYSLDGAAVTVAASTTFEYVFKRGIGTAEFPCDSTALIPMTPIFLPPAWSLLVHVVNRQAGDQLSELRGVWERFYTDGPS